MITEDLIAYIQAQRRKNIADSIITDRLVSVGWHYDDVQEAFRKIIPPTPQAFVTPSVPPPALAPVFVPENIPTKREGPDPYHEQIGQGEPKAMTDKIWAPLTIKPKVEPTPLVIPEVEKKVEVVAPPVLPTQITPVKAVFSQSFSEANTKPSNLPSPEASSVPRETHLEIRSEELIPPLIPKVVPITPVIRVAPVIPVTPAPSIVPKPLFTTAPEPTTRTIPFSEMKITSSMTPKVDNSEISVLPTGALLHSYQKALLSASKVNEDSFKNKRNKLLKWLFVILIVSTLFGSVFAFMGNYIAWPSFNFSFIKKDPKALLIGAPAMLAQLKSYKIETNANISFPPFANITSGLVNGEAVQSHEVDYFSLFAEGVVNNENSSTPIFEYKAKFLSSLFKNDIVASLISNDLSSYVATPDLSELLGHNAPKSSTILVPKGQLDSFVVLLPTEMQSKIENVDLDKLVAIGVPPYVNSETASVFQEFVNSATVVEKEPDNIHGMLTYHYELNVDRASTKKLFSQFTNIFTTKLSSDETLELEEMLGAVSIDSLEVWIGKEDSKIHQYRFVAKVPLSKILSLEDKGIAGNVVSLDWKTTYYDFDIHNDVSLPEDSISISSFMKQVKDMKIKDNVSAFKSRALSLRNALGNYGIRNNPTGSCTNPNPSSLFSPVGHAKGASAAVGNIASLINEILHTTDGALSCYSTSEAWALSAPLASNPNISFCADSTGATKLLTTQLKDTVCK